MEKDKIIKELRKVVYETEREKCIRYAESCGRADLKKYEKRLEMLNEVLKIIKNY